MNAQVNEIQVLEQNAIVAAFGKPGGSDELFDRIAEQARSFVPDVTTRKGREEIGSVAMKVSKSKTLTEKYAKDLVAEEKARFESERVQREKAESEQREARLVAEKEAAELRAKHAAQEERDRAEREQAAKIAAEQKAEAERMANVEHMRTINQEILNKLCEIGLDEGQAKAVITAIAKNQVPNVSVKY